MVIIRQMQLFSWKDIDSLGDLERLQLILNFLPDENLIRLLEKKRGNGRNDYPIRPVWNSIIAGIVFQHQSKKRRPGPFQLGWWLLLIRPHVCRFFLLLAIIRS